MSVNLNGNYNNIGNDTLRLLKLASQDEKIDSKDVTAIEIAAKSDKNYSSGEKSLVTKLKELTKDGKEIKDLKFSNFAPIQGEVSFNIKITSNQINAVKIAEIMTPEHIITNSAKYKLSSQKVPHDGMLRLQYETEPKDLSQTIRACVIDPKKVDISFMVKPGGYKAEQFKEKDVYMVSHGTFMADYQAQGDIKGIDPVTGKESVYFLKGNNTAATGRYALVDKGNSLNIVQGGLAGPAGRVNAHDPKQSSGFMGGMAILFNGQTFKNRDEFLNAFKKNNDESMLNNVFRLKKEDFPHPKLMDNNALDKAKAPRAAVGVTAEGKLIIVHFGEGKFRNSGGVDVYSIYQTLKSMGAVKGALIDGGGAPVMIEKGADGSIESTTPDERKGYAINSSFIVAKRKVK